MTTKICQNPKCRKEKPLDAFGTLRKAVDGKNPWCKECCNARGRKHTALHPEKRQASRNKYAAAHPEKIEASHTRYLETYPERRQATSARYHATHKLEEQISTALYRNTYPERRQATCTRWRQANPDMVRADAERRRARIRGLPQDWTDTQRLFMLQYWGYACAICGNQNGLYWMLAYDHFIPISSPECPGTVAGNMLPLCHSRRRFSGTPPGCNNSKAFKDPHIWLIEYFGKRKAQILERKIATYFALAILQP